MAEFALVSGGGSQALAVMGACAALFLMGSSSLGVVHAPKIVSEHTPDLHSLSDYVAGVVQPDMTQKQKAHTLWEATGDLLYHWCNPVEAPCRRGGQCDDVTDPIKLMNVYGYTLCFCSAGPMEAIWRAGGLEAREFGLPGHVAPEVWYEGQYHYLDVEMKGYFRRPDGRIASIRECGLRPAELMVKPQFPEHFFPLSKKPFRTYLSRVVYAGIADEGPAWYGSYRAQSGHVMNISLRKGETYYRAWDNVGRFICDYPRWITPGTFGTFDVRYGPKDMVSSRSFGNGILIYQPDLTRQTDEYEDGVFACENIVKTDAGLACKEDAPDAWAVFRFELPYVIAGDPHKIEEPNTTTDAATLAIEGTGRVDVLISTDNGCTWQSTGIKGFGRSDLSRFVECRYGYQLKFALHSGAVLRRFRAETSFQLAPTSLPSLKKGANRMTFSLGDAPYEMMTYDLPTWSTREQFEAAVYRSENIRWSSEWPIAVSTENTQKPGYVICRLDAPPGKRLRRVAIDLGGSLRWQQWPEDQVHLSVAESEPTNFHRIGSVQGGPYSSHWNRHLYREVDLPRSRDVRTLYVRFDIFRKFRAAVSACRFRLFFEDQQPPTPNVDDLVVTHGWLEDGQIKTCRRTDLKPPDTYVVQTGEGFQRPLFVCMEVPGRCGILATTDPLGLSGYKQRPASFYPQEAAGHSNAEVLLKLDREGLDSADTMVDILLRGENRKVADEVAKVLGYRPVEKLRPLLESLRKEHPDDPRWRRGLALLDERRASSRAAFLREYLPSLAPDEYGFGYIRKIGEVGTEQDIAPLVEAIEKVDNVRLKLALATAAMALGDDAVAATASTLVKRTRSADHRISVDVGLINRPAFSEAARDRLLAGLDNPRVYVRWELLSELARRVGPDSPPAVDQVAAKGLKDENPWMRLAALEILWRCRCGDSVVREALKDERAGYLVAAYNEFLKRSK